MSKTIIEPYLFFGGRCEEALDFYREALGARVDFLMRYAESPEPRPAGRLPPGFERKVMHAVFRVGEAAIMASDGCESGATFAGFGLSLSVPDEADVDRLIAALADGGEVRMPPSKTFWSPRFGMVTDRFGILWMVGVLDGAG